MISISLERITLGLGICLLATFSLSAQTVSFGSSGLVGETVLNPTSLDFGPDDRLYVSQQNGKILAYTITRDEAPAGSGTYTVNSIEEITIVQEECVNHNDQGVATLNQQRLVTGLLTSGTAQNPIVYVTSSDFTSGAGGLDSNLDTNSGVLSKLEWNGTTWIKIDLVRGLPHSEEVHATNGMDIFENNGNTYLLIAQGGNTNKGAPSNNFAGLTEYYLSGSILIVNLTQLDGMTVYTDAKNGYDFVYDLPTLNDPTRADIDNSHPDFPYPSGHPLYNTTIDWGDPFGGNNALNQAFPENGGPVQILAPGFRNIYDVLVTESGRIYTSDNGPNALWGGFPKIYDNDSEAYLGDESSIIYDTDNNYITNEMNENGSSSHGDPLHFVGSISDSNGTYYGGHPIPIQAFPSKSRVIDYQKNTTNGIWEIANDYSFSELLLGTSGYFNTSFNIGDFSEQPQLGEYLADEPVGNSMVNILDIVEASTNGITEYTASTFNGAMQGNLLTASYNGQINRYILNSSGNEVIQHEAIFNGFGNIPLDVIAQGDNDIFPGTVWATTYGSNGITIFEPSDINCLQPGDSDYNPLADYDNDGYSNGDEIDNQTNICSQGSKPNDFDGDFISDLNDTDDDNDGVLDSLDVFPIDPNNGLSTNLPVNYPFWNNDPNTGLFGLGFTGLMLNTSGNSDYLNLFNAANLSFGGAAGKATIDSVPEGDSFQANNNQENGFQFGVNVDTNSAPFTVHSRLNSPFFGINGNQTEPVNFQSYGISIGTGDQQNYLKFVLMTGTQDGDNSHGLQVYMESNDATVINNVYDIPNILNSNSIDLYFSIDPSQNTAQPYYSLDEGQTLILLGSSIILPNSYLSTTDSKGLAIGLISTSRGSSAPPFTATWDFIEVYENQNGVLSSIPSPLDFGLTPVNNSQRFKHLTLKNLGGPTDDPITINSISFSGVNSSLFYSTANFPIILQPSTSVKIPIYFVSNNSIGTKQATISIFNDGSNSPISFNITGTLTNTYTPLLRINAGGPTIITSDDIPDWESNDEAGIDIGDSYTVSSGGPYAIDSSNLNFEDRDVTIPNSMDATTYTSLLSSERSVGITSPPMVYSINLPNDDYIVNLFFANIYDGTSQAGQRIYSINIEGSPAIEDFDPSGLFGHRIGGMIQHNVSVNDGMLEIEFIRNIENPLINAIEILANQNSLSDSFNEFADNIIMFPNPVSNQLFINAKNPKQIESMRVTSIEGKSVMNIADIESSNGMITIDTSQLSEALYFLTLQSVDGSKAQFKFIVKR